MRNFTNYQDADNLQDNVYDETASSRYPSIQYKEMKTIKRLSQDIADERLRFMENLPLSELSIGIEDGKTVRKIRRIIEKRVCQNWWKTRSKASKSNFPRSTTKRWVTNQFKNIYNCVPEGYRYCA